MIIISENVGYKVLFNRAVAVYCADCVSCKISEWFLTRSRQYKQVLKVENFQFCECTVHFEKCFELLHKMDLNSCLNLKFLCFVLQLYHVSSSDRGWFTFLKTKNSARKIFTRSFQIQ